MKRILLIKKIKKRWTNKWINKSELFPIDLPHSISTLIYSLYDDSAMKYTI